MQTAQPISPALLEEAADWVITLHFSQPSEEEKQAFNRWHGKSTAHQEAWSRAEHMRGCFAGIASDIGRKTLQTLPNHRKRDTMRKLGALLLAVPAGWITWQQMPWPQWRADIATGKGERRTLTLADGSTVTLNGNSAVDIAFSDKERLLILRAGEMLIATHADHTDSPRPFLVKTSHGIARALGTRFSIRLAEDRTRVAVFEHAVEITTHQGGKYVVPSGQQATFDQARILDTAIADPNARQWENGMLVARNMRLFDVIEELNKHRYGFLRCDPAVADLRISGALSLDDVDASLQTLVEGFPLQIREWHRYWIVIEPRSVVAHRS